MTGNLNNIGQAEDNNGRPTRAQVMELADALAQQHALALLNQGEVIAAPTDTVYGVMCRYNSDRGLSRLYTIKGRPQHKAIPILVGDQEQVAPLIAAPVAGVGSELIARFWPGALTIILPANARLSPILTAGQSTVAIRMPDHDHLRALMHRSGPLAATSANLSGRPEAQTAAQVDGQLGDRISLILANSDEENGRAPSPPSTIVDLSHGQTARILRAGPLASLVEEVIHNRC